MTAKKRYDVAILGSGLGGAMIACILARHGVSTLLIEETTHPRFTIGESLIPETGVRLQILGEKYGVPEIGWLGSFYDLQDNISSACGVKRSFSFMYHRQGEHHRAEETNQLPTLTPPFGPDSHLFRQDTDAFFASLAAQLGADFRQQTRIQDIHFKQDGVELVSATGDVFHAAFLVDAGGMRSMVATKLDLRHKVPKFETNTRALYSHFVGLPPSDILFDKPGSHGMPSPLGQATMHHIFDGGWMWIIPFNNHRKSTNPLVSVGMMLDRRKHPEPQGKPEDEFRKIVSKYPTMARHFADAKAVRPWIASGRIQFSSPSGLAHRVLQLPHASSFIDPLYSSGLSVLTVAVDMIAEALLEAVAVNDYDQERFRPVDAFVTRAFEHYDMVISRSLDSFASYDLWNAWNRNWAMGNFLGTLGSLSLLVRYFASGNRDLLAKTTVPERTGVLGSHLPEVVELMTTSRDDIDAAIAGRMSHAEASRAIFDRLGRADFLPPYMGFGDPDQRAPGTFTLMAGARLVLWYGSEAPTKWREYGSFPLTTYAAHAAMHATRKTGAAMREVSNVVRDILFANNDDWKHTALGPMAQGKLWKTMPTHPIPSQLEQDVYRMPDVAP